MKENVYIPTFTPDPTLPAQLGLRPSDIVVTVQPPATEALYHNPAGERLFDDLMAHLTGIPHVRIILLPRNAHQAAQIVSSHPHWFAGDTIIIPPNALDGLNLIGTPI